MTSESNISWKTVFDVMPFPVFVKDSAGAYIYCNDVFAQEIIGADSRYEIIGKTVYDIESIPRELADIYHNADAVLIESRKTQVYQAVVNTSSKVRKKFQFYKSCMQNGDASSLHIVGLMIPISNETEFASNVIDKL